MSTDLYYLGPDYTAETLASAQITPSYNLVSVRLPVFYPSLLYKKQTKDSLRTKHTVHSHTQVSGSVAADVFSDKTSYPLFFRGGAKSLDYTRAVLAVVQSLNIQELTTLAYNEAYLVDVRIEFRVPFTVLTGIIRTWITIPNFCFTNREFGCSSNK